MTEQELIDTINELINEGVQSGAEMVPSDLARRAIERLGARTIGQALKVMAARGCEAAQRELDLAFERLGREMVREEMARGEADGP